MAKQNPVRGKRYTFVDLCRLELRDSPGLMVNINGRMRPVQNSHVTDKDIIKNCPEFAKSIWEYIKETSEWIPVFHFVGTQQELFRLVDHEPYIDPYSDDADSLWVTPKGSPRQQFYEKEEGQIFESGTKSED